ncbi:DUF4124 domain-containing protein [Halopseudomonas sp.]|uniref:DUF4124 domain-containing protein n=1 Tax=Halopseudomonas sp. TaxID=2901191 RepID=UPI0030028493
MRNTLIAIALSMLCSQAMAAKLYKWVDENGVTQFSQQPPASDQYERMDVTAPPKLGSNMAPAATEAQGEADLQNGETETATKKAEREQQAQREAQCAKLRADLTTLENNPRLGRTNEAGEMERIGEEERQAMIAKAREDLATHCD